MGKGVVVLGEAIARVVVEEEVIARVVVVEGKEEVREGGDLGRGQGCNVWDHRDQNDGDAKKAVIEVPPVQEGANDKWEQAAGKAGDVWEQVDGGDHEVLHGKRRY